MFRSNSDHGDGEASPTAAAITVGYRKDRDLSRLFLPEGFLRERELERKRLEESESPDLTPAEIATNGAGEVSKEESGTRTSKRERACRGKPKNMVQVYDMEQVGALSERISKGQEGRGDRADMLKKSCRTLTEAGPQRELVSPAKTWRREILVLRESYPNATPVLDYLESEFTLAEHSRKPLTFTPIGLVGAPGVGKSVIVEAIAKLIRSTLYRIQVEISSHAASLVGTELHWSSAAPGLLFQAIARGTQANPVVMLDELEKCQTRDDYPNVMKVLFSLLEPASARKFQDASLPGVTIDASHVRWIATSNSLTNIPDAIQSRMRFFHIEALSHEQSMKVLGVINARIRKELKLERWPQLPEDVQTPIAKESPRRMQMMLRAAYGSALGRKDRKVTLKDVPMQSSEASQRAMNDSEIQSDQLQKLLFLTNYAALRTLQVKRAVDLYEYSLERI
ncbi:MAG: AAA family ATPase [Rhodoferax sp.]|nr:AAA family ATPase [Rhodoferax sp.]